MRTIVVKPHDNGYEAHEEGKPETWEYGGNQYLAVTRLCHTLWCNAGNKVRWHEDSPAPPATTKGGGSR